MAWALTTDDPCTYPTLGVCDNQIVPDEKRWFYETWRIQNPPPPDRMANDRVRSSPAVDSSAVYVGARNSAIKIHPVTGALLGSWILLGPDVPVGSSPAVGGTTFYLRHDTRLYELPSGISFIVSGTGGMIISSPGIFNRRLFVGTSPSIYGDYHVWAFRQPGT